ncbi:unnamed protein product [Lactuca saligna]|uniref:DUF632 domain-containing protein n=1 Tax=Lactuca saligna TaxID=75948 RepID=A0AA35ZJ83_LACSI|nr:unnamed protein product [Lactuca saligna]
MISTLFGLFVKLRSFTIEKSSQLSGENGSNKHGIEEQVNDLYSKNTKIRNSISKQIEKVRDDELQPQLIELRYRFWIDVEEEIKMEMNLLEFYLGNEKIIYH